MIAVVDYGMGNLHSVVKGLEKAGGECFLATAPDQLALAAAVVLPGVGAFARAMANLRACGMDEALCKAVKSGKPLLGICLGYQLLFEEGEEGGRTAGLGILPGRVRRLPARLKVPHMGWNQIEIARPSPLFAGIASNSPFYFVHSYVAEPAHPELILAYTDYGTRFAAAAGRGHVFGIQFHPEKSSSLGLRILANFWRLAKRC